MKNQNNLKDTQSVEATNFDYDNSELPRDFDIRIEVAEQREVLENL
jgi:hypothetical protein